MEKKKLVWGSSSFFSSLCSRVTFLIGSKAAQQKESGSF